MHEILTLQLGREANYLGTHFWNAQESYFTYSDLENSPIDHDIHFRAGVGADGSDTYTPRAVLYDFKGNFGTLRRINELYEVFGEQRDSHAWGGSTVSQRQPPVEPSSYQQALINGSEPPPLNTSTVRYWSDYARTFYHPRSVVQISETDLNPGQTAFTDWSSGVELFSTLEREEDLVDRDVRPFAEECDQMQGLQMLTGCENAWAGFAARYLDRLRDEFGKLPIWIWGVGGPSDESQARRRSKVVNQAKAVHELSTQASIYVPMMGAPIRLPRSVTMDQRHLWHSSAIQVAGFESVMLPTRLKALQDGSSAILDHLAIALSGGEERRIAQLSFTVGASAEASVTLDRNVNGADIAGTTIPEPARKECDLFPASTNPPDMGQDHVFSEINCRREQERMDSDGFVEVDDVRMERDDRSDGTRRLNFHTSLEMPLPSSFPAVFSVGHYNGQSVPVASSLKTCSSIGLWTQGLERASHMRVDLDEREELSNSLKTISEAYAYGFGSDEEGEWDD